jgi:hypothetical protein
MHPKWATKTVLGLRNAKKCDRVQNTDRANALSAGESRPGSDRPVATPAHSVMGAAMTLYIMYYTSGAGDCLTGPVRWGTGRAPSRSRYRTRSQYPERTVALGTGYLDDPGRGPAGRGSVWPPLSNRPIRRSPRHWYHRKHRYQMAAIPDVWSGRAHELGAWAPPAQVQLSGAATATAPVASPVPHGAARRTLDELSRQVGMPRSTVHDMLTADDFHSRRRPARRSPR